MTGGALGGGTVGKALALLDSVASAGRPVRFTDLLGESPYPKATLYRLLRTLCEQGMLAYDGADHTYRPGMRLVRLAHSAWSQSSLAPIARPHLDALAHDLGMTVHLAQLDGGQVLYLDKRSGAQQIEMYSAAGKTGPAYCTGIGKALLASLPPEALDHALARQAFTRFTHASLIDAAALRAELDAIRARGFAHDREEHEPGIVCVAVPVRLGSGQGIGAVSVASRTSRHSLADLEELVPRLKTTAAAIGADAQAWSFPAPAPVRMEAEP